MVNETAFQNALNAEPLRWSMYFVFADWLEEHGDRRAAGYRWLGENNKCPSLLREVDRPFVCGWYVSDLHEHDPGVLPMDFRWYMRCHVSVYHRGSNFMNFAYFMSLSEARDAVAFAVAAGVLQNRTSLLS
jgi:uncharacterized protein (TIGR02996 family)